MYRNLQPFGEGEQLTQGWLKLVRSNFRCRFILTGTHPSITARENVVTEHAKTLANCVRAVTGEVPVLPVMTCNRAIAMLKILEFLRQKKWMSLQLRRSNGVWGTVTVRLGCL